MYLWKDSGTTRHVCFHLRHSALTIVSRLSFLTLRFIFLLYTGDDDGGEHIERHLNNLRLKCKNPGTKAIDTEEADSASAQSPRYHATQKHGFYPHC